MNFPSDAGLFDYFFAIVPWSIAIVISTVEFDDLNFSNSFVFIGFMGFYLTIASFISNLFLTDPFDIFNFKTVFKSFAPWHIIYQIISQYFEKVSFINALISGAIGFWLKSKTET